jgi:hypothetical protein
MSTDAGIRPTLALAGYLLATMAASLHQHDHTHVHFDLATTPVVEQEHSHGCGHNHAHVCSHSHPHSHANESGHHHEHGGMPLHDDDCVVCQFHSIQVITAPPVVVAERFEVIRPVEPLVCSDPAGSLAATLPWSSFRRDRLARSSPELDAALVPQRDAYF